MNSFDTVLTQRVIFDNNAIEKLAEYVDALGGSRVLIVTDPGIEEAGILNRAQTVLDNEKISCHVFRDVDSNPTTKHVDAAVHYAKTHAPIDLIVGLGGGSAMDTAKGVNFLLTNGGKMEDYWGTNRATKPMLPSIGIPTTIGTGSEAQSYALISQENTHIKMACGDKKAQFRTVILDPTLTKTLPRDVAAITGIDAIAHAVESYVCTKRNPRSQIYSSHAWDLLNEHYEPALEKQNSKARGEMLFGAYLAGLAIENSMLGAAHACANPLTAKYGLTHGIAVALMLPHVIRFNIETIEELYSEIYPAKTIVDRIKHLKKIGELPNKLQECHVKNSVDSNDIPTLANDAADQWTAQFNPRPLQIHDYIELYKEIF
ncbi:iron-containing alcohol dehydrogenase [Candidatus Poribacteria bacterium]|nr:iron-containing alcohol dehydrogenase [Candidatus Poribacteria bacterium]